MELRYQIIGDIHRLRLPEQHTPERTDELWRTTCFEAFIRTEQAESYFELNFSPSTQWAAYRFDAYRSARTNADIEAPHIITRRRDEELVCDVRLEIAGLIGLQGDLELGLASVIEDDQAQRSYWALRHPSTEPDFHHPEAFCATVSAHS